MNFIRLRDDKLERNIDGVEVILVCLQKVHRVLVRLGDADANVKGVHHGLVKVLLQSGIPKGRQIDAVKVLLIPKVGLGQLEINNKTLEGMQTRV